MITFERFMEHQGQSNVPGVERRVAVYATGRMNPPTRGHQRLVESLVRIAKEQNGDPFLFVTKTFDGVGSTYKSNKTEKVRTSVKPNKVKNPLRSDIKLQFINQLFGKLGVAIDSDINALSALFTLKALGYTDVFYVAGGDYFDGKNGDERFIKKVLPTKASELGLNFSLENAGIRTPGSMGVSGYKASYAREAALNGDIGEFRARTGWTGEFAYELMQAIRQGMGLQND